MRQCRSLDRSTGASGKWPVALRPGVRGEHQTNIYDSPFLVVAPAPHSIGNFLPVESPLLKRVSRTDSIDCYDGATSVGLAGGAVISTLHV